MDAKSACPLAFLLPLCHARESTGLLAKVGTNPIFDRNVIGIVAQFLVKFHPCLLRKWDVQFSQGRAVAVHPHLDLVFVVDAWNHRVQSFRGDGTLVKQWGSRGPADGQFLSPSGVAVLNNCIFVTDPGNDRIQVFDLDGVFIRKWGSSGHGDGQFYLPRDVAVIARSQDRILQKHPTQALVYIIDSGNYRVQVFDLDGTFIRKWGTYGSGNGQFINPYGVAVHPTRDMVFISDNWNKRIQVFQSDGTPLFRWDLAGSADEQLDRPGPLALHPTRNLLFVASSNSARVQVFDFEGSLVCKWGFEDQSDAEFSGITGISVHPSQNAVYVVDYNSIRVFSLIGNNHNKRKRIGS